MDTRVEHRLEGARKELTEEEASKTEENPEVQFWSTMGYEESSITWAKYAAQLPHL